MQVQVPPVKNLSVEDAKQRLEDVNLLAETQEKSSRDVDPGKVIGTIPPQGSDVQCEDTVTILVSTGANFIDLPSFVGQRQETAEAQIRRLGLTPDVETRDADEPEGQVIDQDPAAGADGVLKGDTVTLVVSNGAGATTIPDVLGQSETTARSRLSSAGLSVDIIRQDTEDQSEDGRVLDQAPDGGVRAHSGDTVTLVIGNFVEPQTTTTTTTSSTTSTESTTTTP
jgi:serine/threonine-protein kinase